MLVASIELQKAIYRELSKGKYPVFEQAPTNHKYPYILIGNITRTPFDTKTNDGYEMAVTLHAFSESNSSIEAKTMAQFIEDTLTEEFEINGFNNLMQYLSMETAQTEELKDSTVHHYIVEITFNITKK